MSHKTPSTIPPPTNAAGALLFYTYIILALALTSLILRSLRKSYTSLLFSSRPNSLHLYTLSFLTILSFATLSWHMSAFLVKSYISWCGRYGINLPSLPTLDSSLASREGWKTVWQDAKGLYLWRWAASSTLFEDFAREILETSARRLWTFGALSWSMAVGIWMAGKAHRLSIPGAMLYFLLAQILPISFTQNLFALGIIFSPQRVDKPSTKPRNHQSAESPSSASFRFLLLVAPTIAYLISMHIAPQFLKLRHEKLLIPLVIAIRILLFTPYAILRCVLRPPEGRLPEAWHSVFLWLIVPLLGADAAIRWFSLLKDDIGGTSVLFEAFGEGSAMQALGWDMLIGVGSAVIWLVTGIVEL